jgi:hypothetical protein
MVHITMCLEVYAAASPSFSLNSCLDIFSRWQRAGIYVGWFPLQTQNQAHLAQGATAARTGSVDHAKRSARLVMQLARLGSKAGCGTSKTQFKDGPNQLAFFSLHIYVVEL